MTQAAGTADALARARARNVLIRAVRDQLKGHGLDIRELAKELVISSPGHPERGRLYITYSTGEVSHRWTVWEYLGYLACPGRTRDPDEPNVDPATIISTLTHPTRDRPG